MQVVGDPNIGVSDSVTAEFRTEFLTKCREVLGDSLQPATSSPELMSLRHLEDEEPVDIITFIDSPEYLDLAQDIFPAVRLILHLYYSPRCEEPRSFGTAFDGLSNKEILSSYYSEAELESLELTDLVLFIGQRTLKSVTAAIVTLYEIYKLLCLENPQKHYGLAAGTDIYWSLAATSWKQAKETAYSYVEAWRDHSPWFQRYIQRCIQLKAYTVHEKGFAFLHKRIYCDAVHSRSGGLRGYTRLGFVADEIAYFEETAGPRGGNAVYSALVASTRTFKNKARRIFISSPLHQTDMICRLYARCHAKIQSTFYDGKYTTLEEFNNKPIVPDVRMLGFHFPTWELNPNLPLDYFTPSFGVDPENTYRDIAAIPSAAISAYFTDKPKVAHIFNETRPIPVETTAEGEFRLMPYVRAKDRMTTYFLHCDPGAGRPSNFGICVGHMEVIKAVDGEDITQLYIDLIYSVPAKPDIGEVDYDSVRELLYEIIERFGPRVAYSSDRWQDLEFRQKIRSRVQRVDTVVVKLEDYEELKRLIYEGRVDCHPYPRLKEELERLEFISGRRVEKGLNFTKDSADCLAAISRRALEKQVKHLASGFNAAGVMSR